jgi:hypothetical protein
MQPRDQIPDINYPCNTVTSKPKIHHRTKAKTPQSPATVERRPAATGNLEAAPGNGVGLADDPARLSPPGLAPLDIDGEVLLLLGYLEPPAAPDGEAEPAPEPMPGIGEPGVPAPAADPPGAAPAPDPPGAAPEPGAGDPEPVLGAAEEPGVLAPAGDPPGVGAEPEPAEPGVPAPGAEEPPLPVPGIAVSPVAAGIGVWSVAVTGVPPAPHVSQTATVVVIPGPTPPGVASWHGQVAVIVCVVGPRPPVQDGPPVQKPGQTVT